MDLSFLESYREDVVGPVQKEEALLLFAITRVVRPRVIVEFGLGSGRSTLAFLKALTPDATLYSFDVQSPDVMPFPDQQGFHFVKKDLADISLSDIDGREVDLVFFDAAHHLFEKKVRAFTTVEENLSSDALIIVHDTGIWEKQFMIPETDVIRGGTWLNSHHYVHQPGERRFVRWLVEERGYQRVDLFTDRCFRHGLSIVQKRQF